MRDRPVLVYGLVAVALLVLLLSGPTDAQRVFPLLGVFVLAFVGTEVLRRQTEREFPPGEPVGSDGDGMSVRGGASALTASGGWALVLAVTARGS